MRKILVCGAAFAATCVSAVAVPGGAQATTPAPTPPSSVPSAAPTGEPGASTPSGAPPTAGPGSQSPSTSSTTHPGEGEAAPDGEPDGTVTAQAVMVTPELPKFRTYAYGRDPSQRVDAYWRDAGPRATPRPAVLILHGGYWLSGDKGGGWKYFARRLTEEGFVVMSANYRLAPKAQWPAQRDDSLAALTFVKQNARRWNIDPRRIAVIGSSAGGQLATQLGTLGTGTAQVRGVIAMSPPNNPYLAYQAGGKPTATPSQQKLRQAVVDLVQCVPGATAVKDCWDRLEDASTSTHVSARDAPMLLMHGSGDFVPLAQSTGLAGALRAAGVPVTVETIEGDKHAAQLLDDARTYPTIVSWLKNRLKPGPE
ncbi:alpha/beta hydrolase fold domain-containing protein [Actinomadura sp. 3N407]|uniref:alpha/beta hydrolase n=1 Tax=Actinomadura sp. 3N407 TaxID=3457423 RepID=UPI003FCC5FDD